MTRFFRTPYAVLAALVLLVGCATASFKWTGDPFLSGDKSLTGLEQDLDALQALPTYDELRGTLISRNFDSRQGSPSTVVYSWVDTFERNLELSVGVASGAHGTITTEAFAAVFSKQTGLLMDYRTFEIPGLTQRQIEVSTTPVVGAAFAIWLAQTISAAITDAGDNISKEIDEGDKNISKEVDEIDDETVKGAKREIKKAFDDAQHKINGIIEDARSRTGSVTIPSL